MVHSHTLENGITLLLEPIEGVVSVSAGVWLSVGSRHEQASQYGFAHFVEHMLFKGTDSRSANDLARAVDRVGGQQNAATNREYTSYYITVVADYVDLALEILSDMYYNSIFNEEEFLRERDVILEELRMYEDTPDELIHDIFMEKMLQDHPLAHQILGTPEIIGAAKRDDLYSFYRNAYTPENTVVALAGNIDVEKIIRQAEKFFSRSDDRRTFEKPSLTGNSPRIASFHIPRELEQVHFCLGVDGINRTDEDRWALYALSTILGGSMSSRLFQNLREKAGLCYSVYSFHSSYSDRGIFGIYSATSPGKFEKAVEMALEEVRKLLRNGVTSEELEDSKAFMKGNLALSMESTDVRMGQLARNYMGYGRHFSFSEISERISNISLDDFERISHKLFKDQEATLISIGRSDEIKRNAVDRRI